MTIKTKFDMKKILIIISGIILMSGCTKIEKYPAVRGLLERIIPEKASSFIIDSIASEKGLDVFELESKGGKIIIRGSSPTAASYGINYYLNHYCHCQVSRVGINMKMPEKMPAIPTKIHIASPYRYRYFLNYVTYNYNMSFWSWEQWQRDLDWMALHGINLVLAMNGMEAVWQNTLQKFGFSDHEIKEFIPGPAYQSWWLMDNLEGWGGPVSQEWINNRAELQKQVVARMREFSMEPVMQGFYGMVPIKMKEKFPENNIISTGEWCGFKRPYMILPSDTLFSKMAKVFYDVQKKLYGPANFFAGDPFHEYESAAMVDLTMVGRGIQKSMLEAFPSSTWVLMGWRDNPSDKLLAGTDKAHLLIQDLTCEENPSYNKRNAFNNSNFIWCTVMNYGGTSGHNTNLDVYTKAPVEALNSKYAPYLKGIGMMMEGDKTMPLNYELVYDMAWHNQSPDAAQWLKNYLLARYGIENDKLKEVQQLLRKSAYAAKPVTQHGTVVDRWQILDESFNHPKASSWVSNNIANYNIKDFEKAVALLAECSNELKNADTYQVDLVDLTRQALTMRFDKLYLDLKTANNEKNIVRFDSIALAITSMIRDMDKLLSTRKEFMLGAWIDAARNIAPTVAEQANFEWNARALVTIWGLPTVQLYDYSQREWSGLLVNHYLPRWQMFFDYKRAKMKGKKVSEPDYYAYGANWCKETKKFPSEPVGDAVKVSLEMISKYGIGK